MIDQISPLRQIHSFALIAFLLSASLDAKPKPPDVWPLPQWSRAAPADLGMDPAKLQQVRQYALTGGGSGYITRAGRLVMAWGDPRRRYDLKSSTKSIGVTALGLALLDKKVKLDDRAVKYHPTLAVPPRENKNTGWIEQITLQHLATQTAGFEKPGGYGKLLFPPGQKWHYSDAGPNWLAECLTLIYRRDLNDLMFERIFTPLGIKPADLTWRRNAYRNYTIEGIPRREFGSGISANVDAMARLGYLYLRRGRWQKKQLIPADFVDRAGTTVPAVVGLPEYETYYDNSSDHHGLLWWNNADRSIKNLPPDAYWSWGLYDSLIVVIPSLDLVAARAGKSWKRKKDVDHYDVLRPFLEPLAATVRAPVPLNTPPSKP